MHQVRFHITNTEKVFVTNHAIQRFKQRCRLYYTKAELNDIDFTIRKEFKNSKLDMKFEFSPFDRNKLDSKHGKGSFISNTKKLKLIGHYDNLKNIIKIYTVLLNK
jgi:hypothetical protein